MSTHSVSTHSVSTHSAARRRFLYHLSGLSAGAALIACGDTTQAPASTTSPTPCPPDLPQHPQGLLSAEGVTFPFRQHDPAWGDEVMWDRDLVVQAAVELNGETRADAEGLMRAFPDGNTLANEGCEVTALAMALRLFQPNASPPWTPSLLNEYAHYYYYYTPCGLSLVPLYADLLSDVTEGLVQLAFKEERLSGVPGWPRRYAHTLPLVRAYRSLPVDRRSSYLVMLKTGTWDDTVASHYVLLDPSDSEGPDGEDPLILDPAMPLDASGPWRLSDSAAAILEDPEIAAGWEAAGVEPTQICGVWVLVRFQEESRDALLAPLVAAWARELARG